VRTDVIYTLIHRLGLVRVLLFFSVDPLWDLLIGQLRLWGCRRGRWTTCGRASPTWPGQLPAVPGAVRPVDYACTGAAPLELVVAAARGAPQPAQMTMWSDNRNHLLDDLIRDSVFVGVALVVGVAPGSSSPSWR
jgi:hypothetical protein